MANTINQGNAGFIPYYATTGTDLSQVPGMAWDNTNKILTVSGVNLTKTSYNGGYGFSGFSFQQYHANREINSFNFVRGRGNNTSRTVPLNSDHLANIVAAGWGGPAAVTGGYIRAIVNGTPGANSMPTEWVFGTHNGTALADRVKITKDGQLNVNAISNFSGNDLTLSPSGKVVLGAPSKINISGGTNGQVLTTDGAGGLSWTTISSSSGAVSQVEFTNGALSLDYDLDGSGSINSGDAIKYLKINNYNRSTTGLTELSPYTWLKPSWAQSGRGHAVLAVVEGDPLNALNVTVGFDPDADIGDTIFLGNTNSTGHATAGFGVIGGQVVMYGFDKANGNDEHMYITSANPGRWDIKGDVNVNGSVSSSEFVRTKNYADAGARNEAIPTPAAGTMVAVNGQFQLYDGTSWNTLGATGPTGPTGPAGAPAGAIGRWVINVSNSSSSTVATPTQPGEIRANGTGAPASMTVLKAKTITLEGTNMLGYANLLNTKTGRVRIQVYGQTGYSYFTCSASSDGGSSGGVLTLGLTHVYSTSNDWDGNWANKTITLSFEGM